MTYADIQLFMKKLKQLINCNDNPLINIPEIICEKPHFQLLYEDLGFMVHTLFIDKHQDPNELEKLNDLKKRFTDAAEEAQYIVDLFLSGVHKGNNEYFPTSEEDIKPSLSLDDVRSSFNSVKVELMKMDSTRIPQRTSLNQSAAAPPRKSLGSKKTLDEIIVGIDDDAKLIKDKLMEDRKKLDVVSIVGMGGIGKTTLATKVFNDGYVKHHFQVRVWVTVSQTYDKRDVLNQILESISGQSDLGAASDSQLRELVHKKLTGKRYFIVIDDIWNKETWDNLKLFFPHDNNGSRILLTSRLTDVAKHATSNGLIHHLGYLNKEKGWEMLCKKVFRGNECPEWSIKPGMQIIENCKALPLAVAVIAGVLGKESLSEKFWEEIAYRTNSYLVGDQNGFIMETLGLCYDHLPPHLRECFLYLGGFPEDYKFQKQLLILLWVAEGFIQEAGNRTLENIAEGYLMDLIDRNLVVVAHRSNSSGAVKAFKLHDLVRELCLRKAKEEQFILQTCSSHFSAPSYKPIRTFIDKDSSIIPAVVRTFILQTERQTSSSHFSNVNTRNPRSMLCFSNFRYLSDNIVKHFRSFVLLRVLDVQQCSLENFPKGMELLVHLRYLAIWKKTKGFPSSICNLWGLQTLIYIITDHWRIELPSNISDLVNLRHLLSHKPSRSWASKGCFYLPFIEKPMNLQTLSYVMLGVGVDFQKCFPYIKELRCLSNEEIKSLTYLEKLNLFSFRMEHLITFPATLKTLKLACCGLPWSDMSIIQSLPNLQVLKLYYKAFEGSCWNADEHGDFPQLKLLRLVGLDIKQWKADSTSFPCLKQLQIEHCKDLEEIPLEIGEIPTLELIKIRLCRPSVGESVRKIQEHQHDFNGNYDLNIDVRSELKGYDLMWLAN